MKVEKELEEMKNKKQLTKDGRRGISSEWGRKEGSATKDASENKSLTFKIVSLYTMLRRDVAYKIANQRIENLTPLYIFIAWLICCTSIVLK